MTIPPISLILTSIRPHTIAETIRRWEAAAVQPEKLEWCISTHGNVDFQMEYLEKFPKGNCTHTKLLEQPFTSVRGWNNAARVSTGELLVCVADDLVPCERWDEKLTEEVLRWCVPNRDRFCIHVFDGWKPELMTHPIMTRPFYEHQGYFLCPAYNGYWMDSELTEVANENRLLIRVSSEVMQFTHLHPDYGTRERDSFDITGTPACEQDRITYEKRRAEGFPEITV